MYASLMFAGFVLPPMPALTRWRTLAAFPSDADRDPPCRWRSQTTVQQVLDSIPREDRTPCFESHIRWSNVYVDDPEWPSAVCIPAFARSGVVYAAAVTGFDADIDAEDEEGVAALLAACTRIVIPLTVTPNSTSVRKALGRKCALTATVVHDVRHYAREVVLPNAGDVPIVYIDFSGVQSVYMLSADMFEWYAARDLLQRLVRQGGFGVTPEQVGRYLTQSYVHGRIVSPPTRCTQGVKAAFVVLPPGCQPRARFFGGGGIPDHYTDAVTGILRREFWARVRLCATVFLMRCWMPVARRRVWAPEGAGGAAVIARLRAAYV